MLWFGLGWYLFFVPPIIYIYIRFLIKSSGLPPIFDDRWIFQWCCSLVCFLWAFFHSVCVVVPLPGSVSTGSEWCLGRNIFCLLRYRVFLFEGPSFFAPSRNTSIWHSWEFQASRSSLSASQQHLRISQCVGEPTVMVSHCWASSYVELMLILKRARATTNLWRDCLYWGQWAKMFLSYQHTGKRQDMLARQAFIHVEEMTNIQTSSPNGACIFSPSRFLCRFWPPRKWQSFKAWQPAASFPGSLMISSFRAKRCLLLPQNNNERRQETPKQVPSEINFEVIEVMMRTLTARTSSGWTSSQWTSMTLGIW